MKLRELPPVSRARSGAATPSATAWLAVTRPGFGFCDDEVARADDVRDAHAQPIAALFAHGFGGDLRRLGGRPRVGTAPAPTRS